MRPRFDRDGFYREVGQRLQVIRKKRGMTQEQVAGAIGIPRATYASIEGGRQRVVADILWRLAITFGVSLLYLQPEPVPIEEVAPQRDGISPPDSSGNAFLPAMSLPDSWEANNIGAVNLSSNVAAGEPPRG